MSSPHTTDTTRTLLTRCLCACCTLVWLTYVNLLRLSTNIISFRKLSGVSPDEVNCSDICTPSTLFNTQHVLLAFLRSPPLDLELLEQPQSPVPDKQSSLLTDYVNEWMTECKLLESRVEKLSCSCVCETVVYVEYFIALYFLLDCFPTSKKKSNFSCVCKAPCCSWTVCSYVSAYKPRKEVSLINQWREVLGLQVLTPHLGGQPDW